MFSFDSSRGRFAEHWHHVEEILKSAVTIVAGAEDFANSIPERVHSQLRILQYLVHGKLCVAIMSHPLRCEIFEFLVDPEMLKTYGNEPNSCPVHILLNIDTEVQITYRKTSFFVK